MTEGNSVLSASFDLKTVVQLVTTAALVGGMWYAQSDRIAAHGRDMAQLESSVTILQGKLNAVERENAILNIRVENLREVVMELRRQSRRTSPNQ